MKNINPIVFTLVLASLTSAAHGMQFTYTYDSAGRLTRANYGNGASLAYTYDANGNLLTRTATVGVAPAFTLVYLAGAGGTIQGVATQSVAQGAGGTPVTALANQFQRFVQWSDGRTDNPRTDTNVSTNLQVTAQFAPLLAPGGTPHWWLASYGYTSNFAEAEAGDDDKDGYTTGQEYVADTNPTNAASYLRLTRVDRAPPMTVYFDPSSSNRVYTLWWCECLQSNTWAVVPGQERRPGSGGSDSMTDTNANSRSRFYRLRVTLP